MSPSSKEITSFFARKTGTNESSSPEVPERAETGEVHLSETIKTSDGATPEALERDTKSDDGDIQEGLQHPKDTSRDKRQRISEDDAETPSAAQEAKRRKVQKILSSSTSTPHKTRSETVSESEKDARGLGDDERLTSEDENEEEIEEIEADESAPRVTASSKAGKSLLESLGHDRSAKISGPGVGSLFGQTLCTPKTQISGSLSSPLFAPSSWTQSEVFTKLRGDEGGKSSSNLQSKSFFAVKKRTPTSETSSALFQLLAHAWDEIENLKASGQGSKKKVVVILTNVLRVLLFYSKKDVIPTIYLSSNKVAPDYENVEVGIGESIIMRTIVETYGRSEAAIKQELVECEDLGVIAASSRCQMRTLVENNPLTIKEVFDNMALLPTLSGGQSQSRKKEIIKRLLVAARGSEPKYVCRFLQGKMRIGVQQATIFQALACAFCLSPQRDGKTVDDVRRTKPMAVNVLEMEIQSLENAIRTAYCELPNIAKIVALLLDGETEDSLRAKCRITPGIPVQPMLAKPTKSLTEIFDRFKDCRFTCEFKYDGERQQIHVTKTGIKLFSRNLEDTTTKFPDVAEVVRVHLRDVVTECILDTEVVAYDTENKRILPFQVLSTRKRKDVTDSDVSVQVCVFAFDCIQYNGESLLREPLEKRRKILHSTFNVEEGKFELVNYRDCENMEEVDAFFQESQDGNCEGLMVKTLTTNASYEPSKRSLNWLKLKKDYVDAVGDSVDVVPIGAYLGRGKRSRVYGAYLLAVYNTEDESYQTVCKAGTGFSEEMLEKLHSTLSAYVIDRKKAYYQVHERLEPDVWFEAKLVWEVKAADLSLSPVHTAARNDETGKGIGLRFPRFLRVRDDKKPEEATTAEQIDELYRNQFSG